MMSLLFETYRAATALIEPAGRRFLAWRLARGKEDPARLGERLGIAGADRPLGRLVWLHGASVGEGVSLLPLVESLADRGWHVLVTTGTVNSARVMAARLPSGVVHQFVPLDLPGAVRRFLNHWRPDLVLLAESELWPNLMHEIGRAGIGLALVNARISERSARRWTRARRFIGTLLSHVDLCLCQTAEDAARFERLGCRRVTVTGHLKFDVPPPAADPLALATLVERIGDRPVWIAASTHADEEAALLDAHARLKRQSPDILSVIVPRQPDRGTALVAAARRQGLVVAQRSEDEAVAPGTEVLVADTLGELGLFYRLSNAVFVGKSLVAPGGGQNPIEPAKLGCAILHGPHTGNFTDIYAILDRAGGAVSATGPGHLAETLSAVLQEPERRNAMARASEAVVTAEAGATARTLAALTPWLAPRIPETVD